MPAIQASLDEFISQWNYHGRRTMRSMFPLALWYPEMVASGLDDVLLYCVDPEGPVPDNHANEIRRLLPDPLVDDGIHGIAHTLTIVNYLKMRYQDS